MLWSNEIEIHFFKEALKSFASHEQLFYSIEDRYFAFVPKDFTSKGHTLQSRNSLVGKFTEKWARDLLNPLAESFGLYAVNNVVCPEIGLPKKSSADLAFCKSNKTLQKACDIKLIFEIKMSIVSNYEYKKPNKVIYSGDYTEHKGNPSLLRSDSMLKAIGKALNIRASGTASANIPIVILGNSPITEFYLDKVDYLQQSGVVQGIWSLNPAPTVKEFIKSSKLSAFQTIDSTDQLRQLINDLINGDLWYFSSMLSKEELGKILQAAQKEKDNVSKAEKFLSLLRRGLNDEN